MENYKILSVGDLDGEIWVPVKNYSNIYHISNLGRVKSLARYLKMPNSGRLFKPESIISQRITPQGYLYFNLCKNGTHKSVTVHRLIATYFKKNPNPKLYRIVRHLDNNKLNNCDYNLEWTSHSINNKQAYDDGIKVHIGIKGHKNPCSKQVDQYTKEGEFVKRHLSRVDAQNETGVPNGQINNVVSGRQKSAGGFIWKSV